MGIPRSLWAVLAFVVCLTEARAAHYVRGDSGDFSDPLWTNIDTMPPTPDSGPPGPGDIADMTGGAAATITASGGSVDTVEGTSNFDVTGAFSATTLQYTGMLMGAGTLTVTNVAGSSPLLADDRGRESGCGDDGGGFFG